MNIIGKIRKILLGSTIAHLEHQKPTDLKAFIDLVDRFIDGRIAYPLEWDDFVSWGNDNAYLEEIRTRIEQAEPLLFSGKGSDREAYISVLVQERNKAAALIGEKARLETK